VVRPAAAAHLLACAPAEGTRECASTQQMHAFGRAVLSCHSVGFPASSMSSSAAANGLPVH
jgi:hypothetical protein